MICFEKKTMTKKKQKTKNRDYKSQSNEIMTKSSNKKVGMSSPKTVVVLLVVSLLLMQVNPGLAAENNGSISIEIVKISAPPPKSGALSNSLTQLAAWIIPIGLGPAGVQALNVLIDTGKSDLWVADTSCRSFWCQNVVGTMYNSGRSPVTFINTRSSLTLKYFDGKQVSGITSQDQFSINSVPVEVIGRQDFIRVTSANGFATTDVYDGILGLAPGRNTRNRLSVIEKLFEGNFINSKFFSFITNAAGATFLNIGNVPVLTGNKFLSSL